MYDPRIFFLCWYVCFFSPVCTLLVYFYYMRSEGTIGLPHMSSSSPNECTQAKGTSQVATS